MMEPGLPILRHALPRAAASPPTRVRNFRVARASAALVLTAWATAADAFDSPPGPVITTFAGNGTWAPAPDGSPATSVGVVPYGVAVTPDGSIALISDTNANVVYLVTEGAIKTGTRARAAPPGRQQRERLHAIGRAH